MSQPLQQRNTRSLLTWLPLVMLAGSIFLYMILMSHIRHMKHQQLHLKQTNTWNAFALDTLHMSKRIAGEYQIAAGILSENVAADSANLAFLRQAHRLNGKNYIVTTYISAKEYRHLQTPLAIIRSKVELLAESPGLTEDNAQLLQEITEANVRLSQMNKNLLLLTRIENSQFPEIALIDLSQLVERLTHFFTEYYENDVAKTTTTLQPGVRITANPALTEILVNNLLRNDYIHNVPGGWVDIHLTSRELVIENAGTLIHDNPERLFDRFRKGRVDNRTTGLGLALARQITQLYHYDISYTYKDGKHKLTVSFS